MSTRSIIGTTDGTTFTGVYCHSDGYPSHMVRALAKIITRDGEAALPVLTGQEKRARGGETANWDCLEPEMPSADTEPPYPDFRTYVDNVPVGERDSGIVALLGHLTFDPDGEKRGQVIEGYGTVMTRNPLRFSGAVTDREADTGWCQWAYLFTDDLTVIVYEIGEGLTEVERFTRDDLAAITEDDEATCQRIRYAECGKNFSRCNHVAWAHDDTAPDESKRLGMLEWLGVEPISLDQATGAVVKGERYEFTGGGRSNGPESRRIWELSIKGGGYLPALRMDSRGRFTKTLPGVELILPPTKAEFEAARI